MRLRGIHADAGRELGADGGVQIEFACACGGRRTHCARQSGAFGKNLENLRGGCVREEERQRSSLRDDAGDDHVPAGEVGSGGMRLEMLQVEWGWGKTGNILSRILQMQQSTINPTSSETRN